MTKTRQLDAWHGDFGEFWMIGHSDLTLPDYGFFWKRSAGIDNLTWWLFRKG